MNDDRPAPFELRRPEGAPSIVYDSPHSGRWYPPTFVTAATQAQLRWAEDAYVDELFPGVDALGVALLTANFPRAWIDLNRAADDIDESLLDAPWPAVLAPTEKSGRGLGLIRRFVVPGVAIYPALLPVAEVQSRIDEVYHPYHGALDALLEESRAAHGVVWHVNWHSMKSRGNAMTPDGVDATRPDFVVSDRDGASAAPEVTSFIVDALRRMGYSVSVNDPYKGGAIVQRAGHPARGIHSVQVEINRALYLHEPSVTPIAGMARLRRDMLDLTSQLALAADARGGRVGAG